VSEIRLLSAEEKKNLSANVFYWSPKDYLHGSPEICEALLSPKSSSYDYFMTFEPNAPSFTEGVKGLIEAGVKCGFEGFKWAVKEIISQQKNHSLDTEQVWHVSGLSGSTRTRLEGYHGGMDDWSKDSQNRIPDLSNKVVMATSYDESLPEGVSVVLWVTNVAGSSVILLPSEFEGFEKKGV